MRVISVPAEVRQALEAGFDLVISVSGGKDSQAMLKEVTAFHRSEGFTGRLVAVHSDLGRVEWHETDATVQAQAQQYGVDLVIVRRQKGDLVDRIEERFHQLEGTGKPFWPSSAQRYCTSDLKRDVIDKYLRTFERVICAVGIRHEESVARSKKPCWEPRKRITTKSRTALTWHPLIDWTEEDVFQSIGGRHGQNVHRAYGLGNDRLSCSLCIMASRCDLLNGVKHNPELARRYMDLEQRSGFTFTSKISITELWEEVHGQEVAEDVATF